MVAQDLEQRCQVLSAGGAEIESALAALDAKLREWLEALHRVPELRTEAASLTDAAPPGAAARRASSRLTTGTLPLQTVAEPAPDEAAPGEEPTDADDEVLLASLDPQTANAIRVKRRMTKNKRSVRELLAEIQAARAETKDPPRRSWLR